MIENTTYQKKEYVNAKKLLEAFNESCVLGKCNDRLLLMFQKIAKHFSTTFRYVNKCDELACINYAVSEAWQKWTKFDPEKSSNIFSFFTTMISNDLKLYYKKLTKGKGSQISIDSLFSNENK